MLDIGWTELLAIAVLTILVVGPKDLPKVLRTVGQWTAKARAITREFQDSLEDMARQSELDEIKREIDATTYNDIGKLDDIVDPTGTMEKIFELPKTSDSKANATGEAAGTGAVAAPTAEPAPETAGIEPAAMSTDAPDDPAEDVPQRQDGS